MIVRTNGYIAYMVTVCRLVMRIAANHCGLPIMFQLVNATILGLTPFDIPIVFKGPIFSLNTVRTTSTTDHWNKESQILQNSQASLRQTTPISLTELVAICADWKRSQVSICQHWNQLHLFKCLIQLHLFSIEISKSRVLKSFDSNKIGCTFRPEAAPALLRRRIFSTLKGETLKTKNFT